MSMRIILEALIFGMTCAISPYSSASETDFQADLFRENVLVQNLTSSSSLSDTSAAAATNVQTRYDVAYSMCQTVAPVGGADYPVANEIYPTAAAANYFINKGIPETSDLPKVTLIVAPKHGELSGDGYAYGVYLYKPSNGYLGGDSMTFTVEVQGKIFKVIYSVDVVLAPDSGSPSCPTGNGIKELPKPATGRSKLGSLDIWELPSATQYDAETLAQLHSMLNFEFGAGTLSGSELLAPSVGVSAANTTTLTSSLNLAEVKVCSIVAPTNRWTLMGKHHA